MKKNNIKKQVIRWRRQGKTYSEIQNLVGRKIPKSTLSFWCKHIKLPEFYQTKIKNLSFRNLEYARLIAGRVHIERRKKYLKKIEQSNKYLIKNLANKDCAKLLLATLYLAEGGKKTKGSLMFGNSDPAIIRMFLKLLRFVYKIDESKFRCTLQCRADQDINLLEKFWSKITGIPKDQFYKARVDKRSIGQRTKKKEYKGVCKIDYFSAHIFYELTIIGQIITK